MWSLRHSPFTRPPALMSIARLLRNFPVVVLPALAALAACDPSSGTGPDDQDIAEVSGSYEMVMFRTWPMPYFDLRTQESVTHGVLELKTSSEFLLVESGRWGQEWTYGRFELEGDTVTLIESDGSENTYHYAAGVLAGEESVFIRPDADVPPEYRWTQYGLETCDGRIPSYIEPCDGSHVSGSSSIWLRDNGRYDLAETAIASTVRSYGDYELDGDAIVMSGMPEQRSTGSLRGDSLTLGGWIYLRIQ